MGQVAFRPGKKIKGLFVQRTSVRRTGKPDYFQRFWDCKQMPVVGMFLDNRVTNTRRNIMSIFEARHFMG
jgi:hypothetical protein